MADATVFCEVLLSSDILCYVFDPDQARGIVRLVTAQGPVVQNLVSLLLSLSPQLANYISASKANTSLFFVEKM